MQTAPTSPKHSALNSDIMSTQTTDAFKKSDRKIRISADPLMMSQSMKDFGVTNS